MEDLQRYVLDLVEGVNARYRQPGYEPVVWLERPVPLYERIALYSIAGGWGGCGSGGGGGGGGAARA